MTTTKPFANDAEFLDFAIGYLQARATRVGQEIQIDDAQAPTTIPWNQRQLGVGELVGTEESMRRLADAKDTEQKLKQALKERVQAHRTSSRPPLGIDVICEEHGLNDDERLLLLVVVAAAISERTARRVLEPLGGGMMAQADVQTCIQFLDPQDTAGWLRGRVYFQRTAPLVKQGLTTLDYCSRSSGPADLLPASVSCTTETFSMVTGCSVVDESEDVSVTATAH